MYTWAAEDYTKVVVWTFGHAVREIERSHHQVVIEESATTGVAVVFFGFAAFIVIVSHNAIGAVGALWFVLLGVYASVTSLFIADREMGVLLVRRRVMWWTLERTYQAVAIDRVYVRSTIRKGSGLAMRMKSGRSKDLTMSLGSENTLNGAAAALNHFLYTPHRG